MLKLIRKVSLPPALHREIDLKVDSHCLGIRACQEIRFGEFSSVVRPLFFFFNSENITKGWFLFQVSNHL